MSIFIGIYNILIYLYIPYVLNSFYKNDWFLNNIANMKNPKSFIRFIFLYFNSYTYQNKIQKFKFKNKFKHI